ncbi:hypothetical protein HanIR_Chr16g0804991 [Helianthus annuus]|nr:hypothetical protein HanIR_Chr16g0804991 [Helianthus annuus]
MSVLNRKEHLKVYEYVSHASYSPHLLDLFGMFSIWKSVELDDQLMICVYFQNIYLYLKYISKHGIYKVLGYIPKSCTKTMFGFIK